MDSTELLDMKLHDVSDVLLQELCERGVKGMKVDLPGRSVSDGKRMMLSVCLNEVE